MNNVNLRGHVILVVNDEIAPFFLELPMSLERAGAETVVASSPTEGLKRFGQFDFTAAILDYAPTPDHHNFLDELSGMPVLLHGSTRPAATTNRPFIQKPARVEEITAVLAGMLSAGAMPNAAGAAGH